MKKAAISSIIAIILGYLGTVFGAEIMNWPQLGPILSIVVMGAAIITSLENDKWKFQFKRHTFFQYDLAIKHLNCTGWRNAKLRKNTLSIILEIRIYSCINSGCICHSIASSILKK